MASTFPLPGVKHGERLLPSVVQSRALNGSNDIWVSVPVDENDVLRGFRDISYGELNNAANHAALWLSQHLPESSAEFQPFAYAGPKDLRYPILAVAAAKLRKVMILPSPLTTPEAQIRILDQHDCRIYIRPEAMAEKANEISQKAPDMQMIVMPGLDEFLKDTVATPCVYTKTWDEAKDDPWMVFHTSETTGHPKPIAYTHRMMAFPDAAAAIEGLEECLIHYLPQCRWHTPLPTLHLLGTMFVLSMPTFLNMVAVIGPPTFPSPETMEQMIQFGRVEGILVPPAVIDATCRTASGLAILRQLKYVFYVGAPLSSKSADLLTPHTMVAPVIGSTEGGGYWVKYDRNSTVPFDYVKFLGEVGVTFEHRFNDLYELVFVRRPDVSIQQIFIVHPEKDRYETRDLFVEHPQHKGYWKIVGRTDDYVYLAHGDGLHASRLEPEIEAHPAVKSVLIGGHACSAPVLLVELYASSEEIDREAMVESLKPYIDRVNVHCHDCVKLSTDRVLFASAEKPFVQTVKGSVARMQTLALYEEEITGLFA
ncbi:hypothetical protein FE257_010857 [Aspergillus nanangensis]|uniref:AMP-dependent synthetase/ligase domain-containing protein n=1 Tax=Aspergillus nanangensis TaxID=2582783 RepID=A0AAD4GYA0_ASPNN|nr:hypothetical protein FE257_010857 [Aspergillus nanangensis]